MVDAGRGGGVAGRWVMRDADTSFMSDDELYDALSNSGPPLPLREYHWDRDDEVLSGMVLQSRSLLLAFPIQAAISHPDTHTSHPFSSYLKTQPSASVTSRLPSNLSPKALHPTLK